MGRPPQRRGQLPGLHTGLDSPRARWPSRGMASPLLTTCCPVAPSRTLCDPQQELGSRSAAHTSPPHAKKYNSATSQDWFLLLTSGYPLRLEPHRSSPTAAGAPLSPSQREQAPPICGPEDAQDTPPEATTAGWGVGGAAFWPSGQGEGEAGSTRAGLAGGDGEEIPLPSLLAPSRLSGSLDGQTHLEANRLGHPRCVQRPPSQARRGAQRGQEGSRCGERETASSEEQFLPGTCRLS